MLGLFWFYEHFLDIFTSDEVFIVLHYGAVNSVYCEHTSQTVCKAEAKMHSWKKMSIFLVKKKNSGHKSTLKHDESLI